LWTERLLRHAARLTVVDSSPEMLAITRTRIAHAQAAQPDLVSRPLDCIQADLFTWQPGAQYDVIFFGFWLSHVPPEDFDAFWARVRAALSPGGRVCFVDSLYTEQSTAHDHQLEGSQATTVTRRLNDGHEYRIVKVFYPPEELAARLTALGWRASIQATPTYFFSGEARELEAHV
ncbi:MAG TPA: class I SAM-dependent methyltransferase, partial [Ktedonobacterales bacterium]|nr:class I SAM-dependent methyltransferase [Ktedonobacterales bacterium]